MLQKQRQKLKTVASLQRSEGLNQRDGNEFVVFHTHLNRRQHSKVVLREILNQIGV